MTSVSIKTITSMANPLVKELAALQAKKHREESGLFLLEGAGFVRAALDAGWVVETVLVGDWLPEGDIRDVAGKARVLAVTADILRKITRRENPQPVVGVVRQRFAEPAAVGKRGLWLALDRVRDPGNLGTIIRTTDAAGVAVTGGGIVLVGDCCEPFAPETVRATMGSVVNVPVVRMAEGAFLAAVTATGVPLVGTHLAARAVDYRAADYTLPMALALGSESDGLSPDLAAACGQLVKIPMRGGAESLNLSVAAGVMVYRILR